MKIRHDDLKENGYILLDVLHHKELVPFIRTYLKKGTLFTWFYYLANLIAIFLVGFFFQIGYLKQEYSIGTLLNKVSYGLAISFALLPVHEYIHVVAYKSQGARNTSMAANFKKFYFMALANKFVVNRIEFIIVALAPFAIISSGLAITLIFFSLDWALTISSALLAHTAMCSGDFGLLSYFEWNKEKNVVSYDDVENQTSYFYGKLVKAD